MWRPWAIILRIKILHFMVKIIEKCIYCKRATRIANDLKRPIIESAKSRAPRALVPHAPPSPSALVPHMPHMPRVLRALVPQVLRALRALVPHMLSCLTCSPAQRVSRA